MYGHDFDSWKDSHPGWRFTGFDWDGMAQWEIIPEQQPTVRKEIRWLNPLTDPALGTAGVDAGLIKYTGASEAQKEQYEAAETKLLTQFGVVKDSLSDKLEEQAATQSGAYVSGKRINKVPGKLPTLLIVAFAAMWFYK